MNKGEDAWLGEGAGGWRNGSADGQTDGWMNG